MTPTKKDTIQKLLLQCKYLAVIALCEERRDADEWYFLALAYDQHGAIRKGNGQTFKIFLKKARREILIGREHYPQDLRFLFLLGLINLHTQNPKEALRCFEEHYKISRDPKMLISIANAQKADGDFLKAIRTYRRAQRFNISSPLLMYHNIAAAYLLMGNKKKALSLAKKGLLEPVTNPFEEQIHRELERIVEKYSPHSER